jgi:hypothetical protein
MDGLDRMIRLQDAADQFAKRQVIADACASGCDLFFELVRLAVDPFLTFGLKRVAEILDDDGSVGDFSAKQFLDLCQQLSARQLRGESAREAVMQAASRCHTATWNSVYRRVLQKDIGIDGTFLNDVIDTLGPDAARHRVAEFRPQMPSKSGKAVGRRLVDAMITGERVLAVLDGVPRLHAADGKALTTYNLIEAALEPLCARVTAPLVLDGMIADGTFHVFDTVPLQDFQAKLCPQSQQKRRTMLEGLQRNGVFSDPRLIKVVPQVKVDFGHPDGTADFDEFCRQAAAHGHAAVVLKKPESPYVGKRSTAWAVKKL